MKTLRRALRFFRPDAPRIALVGLLLVLSAVTSLLKPWPLAWIVDSILGNQPLPGLIESWPYPRPSLLLLLCGVMLALHLAQTALATAQKYLAIDIGLRALRRVRNEVFACLQCLSLRFHQGTQTGDIIYRATWDTCAFQTLFQQGLVAFSASLLSLALMVLVMTRLSARLTLIALGTVPALILSIRFFGRAMQERGVAAQEADSRIASLVQQAVANLPLIQSFTREPHEQAKFDRHTATARSTRLTQHGWELLYGFSMAVVFALGSTAIVWHGGRQVLAAELTVGQLLVFLAYLAQFYEPLSQLAYVGTTVSTASAGAHRIFELLDTPEEVKTAPAARRLIVNRTAPVRPTSDRQPAGAVSSPADLQTPGPVRVDGHIEFQTVSFAYRPEQPVLEGISFSLPAGQAVAVVGPSGAGKTSLLNLLPRLFDPTAGAILLGGVDIREVHLGDLRRHIGLVPQEPVLLSATIAENIAYGKPEATPAEIEQAALAAYADSFIRRLPHRYETVVGEGAERLSLGEKQRVNLARAFLKDAPILILDEPTSALDAESEALVSASLEKLMRGRTTLIVAHRARLLRLVNWVLVLEDGRVSAFDTVESLLRREGYFARLMRS
jgi:ATP-binding cassette subfamily B protein/subfamily B ATP-binding cassette protein MsbA